MKIIKDVRNAMDRADCVRRSELICKRLSELPEYVNARNICAYISKGNEVDTKLIIERAWADGKHVYVPKVYGKEMEFIEIADYGELKSISDVAQKSVVEKNNSINRNIKAERDQRRTNVHAWSGI